MVDLTIRYTKLEAPGLLTKRAFVDGRGELAKEGCASPTRGVYTAISHSGDADAILTHHAAVLRDLTQQQALILAPLPTPLRPDGEKWLLCVKADPDDGTALPRTGQTFGLVEGPAVMVADIDIPPELRGFIRDADELRTKVLLPAWAGFGTVAMLIRPSVGSGVKLKGKPTVPPTGYHVYFVLTNGTKIKAVSAAIFDRLALRFAVIEASKRGNRLRRALIDPAAASGAERLVFEADPYCEQGVEAVPRDTVLYRGDTLDAKRALKGMALSRSEKETLGLVWEQAEKKAKPALDQAREKWLLDNTAKLVKERKLEPKAARAVAERQVADLEAGELGDDYVIMLDDGTEVSVYDILSNPDRYAGARGYTLDEATPRRGVVFIHPYPSKADPAVGKPPGPWLHSFEHGGRYFKLRSARLEQEFIEKWYDPSDQSPPAPPGQAPFPSGGGKYTQHDFLALLPAYRFINRRTGLLFPEESVNAFLGLIADNGTNVPAALWLVRYRPIQQMTWAPGNPTIIHNTIVRESGFVADQGSIIYNSYVPPIIESGGDPALAKPWLDHVRKLYPDEAEEIFDRFAHRAQKPHEKINHVLYLGGAPGIGKDSLLLPLGHAVGNWNFKSIKPDNVLDRFNGFMKSTVLLISEARDLGDTDAFAFYERLKLLAATPPQTILIDEKFVTPYRIPNVAFVILTSNYLHDGPHLPADDRRHFIVWSELPAFGEPGSLPQSYFDQLHAFYDGGGFKHVHAFLAARDISKFNAAAPPRKTPAFWAIVDSQRAPEESALSDAIEVMKEEERLSGSELVAFTMFRLQVASCLALSSWLVDRKYRRQIPKLLEKAGFTRVPNPYAKDRLWLVGGKRQVIYGRKSISEADRLKVARGMA